MSNRLTDEAMSMLEQSFEDRKDFINSERFIYHARAQKIHAYIDDIITKPPQTRTKGLLLLSPTNNGKTSIIEHFLNKYPPDPNLDGDSVIVPVMFINMPSKPNLRNFYIKVLDRTGARYRRYSSTADLGEYMFEELRRIKLKALFVDEIHNLSAATTRSSKLETLNLLREIGNEVKVAVIGAGVARALVQVYSDEELASRFDLLPIPKWKPSRELEALLNTWEKSLPLKNASNLSSRELMHEIVRISEGTIGEIIDLLQKTAIRSIRTGEECISVEGLNKTPFIPPSKRKEYAKRVLELAD